MNTVKSAPEAVFTDKATHSDAPEWDNSSEYPSLSSPEFANDENEALDLIASIANRLASLTPLFAQAHDGRLKDEDRTLLVKGLQALSQKRERCETLMRNLITFVYCEMNVNASDQEAVKTASRLKSHFSQLHQTLKPYELFLINGPERLIEDYLDSEQTRGQRFRVLYNRKLGDTFLPEAEEKLLTAMSVSGHQAWGDLYDAIAGQLKCQMSTPESNGTTETIGLAQASGYLRSSDEQTRKAAWNAINQAWDEQREPCAAILNALAGWRLEVVRRRSYARPIDFLTHPLHQNSIQRETLEAMLGAIRTRIDVPRRGLANLARVLGKDRLDPWDLLCSPPARFGSTNRSFHDGFELVAQAFENVHPELSDFVRMMRKNRWIEARVRPNKQQGAYCTEFEKSSSPRVFQTYMGSVNDISTLAHELGHAYHSWAMRDLPLAERDYPSTLAETASIFAETAVAGSISRGGDATARFEIGWEVTKHAVGLLLNIPARYEFEKTFYERRKERFVPADELCELTEQAWRNWYGEGLSTPDRMFWASKLHFSMAGTSFYNFPYAFGYLFSLGVYAQRESLGDAFFDAYKGILRDTGRMTAEDLIRKHLGEDISQPQFWLKSLAVVERDLTEASAAIEQLI